MSEPTMFENWCALNGRLQPIPASPTTISSFVRSIAPLGIDKVFAAVQEISRAHYTIGLPCPCSGPGLVTSAINAVSKVTPPRSWSKPMQAQFMHLPWDVQSCIVKRETERDQEVRRSQNEANAAKQELKQLKKESEIGENSHAA